MWITYLADKLNAGVMIACPGVSGANDLAAASSWGPAALWIMPEMPLPASKDGLAEITIISLCAVSKSLVKTAKFSGAYIELFFFELTDANVL